MVVVTVSDPPTALSLTPSAGLPPFDSNVTNVDPEAIVPVARFNARPVPFSETSFTVNVLKFVPATSVPVAVVLPIVKPCS